MTYEQLDRFFNPKSIAIIGASNKKTSVGYGIFRNLKTGNLKNKIYPVNIKRERIQGHFAYNTLKDIKEKIDLVVIATPPRTIIPILNECKTLRIKAVIIISAGFNEIGLKGQKLTKNVLDIARSGNIRIMGPNCLGFIRPSINLNTSFSNITPDDGNIAFISQSGALGTAMIERAKKHNMGFSFFVSLGSMIDLGFHDIIDYLVNDPKTSSIVIYMESLTNARKFLSAARSFSRSKPIIVLKVGKSNEGAKAAMSHTGTLAGNDNVFDAAFKRAGIVRVHRSDELFDCAVALSKYKPPRGNKIAIITNAGGPGVIATDYLVEKKGHLAKFSKKTNEKLIKYLPFAASKNNPIDLLGDASPDRYKVAIETVMNDENVDGIIVILTPQSMTESTKIAQEIVKIKNRSEKPILTSWMGGHSVDEGREILEKGDIPVYVSPERAVRAFIALYHYSKNLEKLYETPGTIPHAFKPDTIKAREIITNALKNKRTILTERESKSVLECFHIPTNIEGLAKSPNDAIKIAKKIGYPIVMKIASPDVVHKTDVGGIKLNINSDKELITSYKEIMSNVNKYVPKANIHGVIINKMQNKKYELLIGSKKDPIFGPIIVFGMGGVAVDIFKDINIGLPPLNMSLSLNLIKETKIYELLKGYRNQKPVDLKSIQFLLYKFSYLISDIPEIAEIDINPFSVDEHGGIVLDSSIILDKKSKFDKNNPYKHLVISPYPKEFVKTIKTKNNKKVLLRPIIPEDEELEEEMFTNMSETTQKFRFFGTIKEVTHELLTRYTQIDYDREMAIIALTEEENKKKMAGVVRVINDPFGHSAEFAIVIADPYQKNGIGNDMMDFIIEISKKRGIKKLYAYYLRENKIIEKMFEKRGFKITQEQKANLAELDLN